MSYLNDKYTTAKRVSKEDALLKSFTPKQIEDYTAIKKINKELLEKDKELLSNDAFALGEMLEILKNAWVNK